MALVAPSLLLNGYIYLYSYARDGGSSGFFNEPRRQITAAGPGGDFSQWTLSLSFPTLFSRPKGSCRSSGDSGRSESERKRPLEVTRRFRPAHAHGTRDERVTRGRNSMLSLFFCRCPPLFSNRRHPLRCRAIVCRSSLASRVSDGARTKTRPLKPQVGATLPFLTLLSLFFSRLNEITYQLSEEDHAE